MQIESEVKISHITGVFISNMNASHVNGAGIAKSGQWENYTIVKTFQDGIKQGVGPYRVPFWSSASEKYNIRSTEIEETGWDRSVIRAVGANWKGNTNKISSERDPVLYAEDDQFGYMYTYSDDEGGEKPPEVDGITITAITRTAPFTISPAIGLRKSGWIGKDENYVHLEAESPIPYKTQFMNTALETMFSLNYARLGVFRNVGDRHELSQELVKLYLENKVIVEREEKPKFWVMDIPEEIRKQAQNPEQDKPEDEIKKSTKSIKKFEQKKKEGKVYELADKNAKKRRAAWLLRSITLLRGGAKQAQFLTDVSPKFIIMAGLSCGNPIFNYLFEDKSGKKERFRDVALSTERLTKVIEEYNDRIVTPVYIGMLTGYMENEEKIVDFAKTTPGGKEIVLTTPRQAAEKMISQLGINPEDIKPFKSSDSDTPTIQV